MEKKGVSVIIITVVVIFLILVIGGYFLFSWWDSSKNQPHSVSSAGNDANAKNLIGSCTDHIYLNGEWKLHSCIEYWGEDLKERGCTPDNEYYKAEWTTKRCSTDNALGVCRLTFEGSPRTQIIIYDFEERTDDKWCTENYKGENLNAEFISVDELS